MGWPGAGSGYPDGGVRGSGGCDWSAGKAGLTSINGANVELASFQNWAFPYHGLIPNYQETGKSRPFLDVDDNGRLGHSSPRGKSTGRTRPIAIAACFSPRRKRSIQTGPA